MDNLKINSINTRARILSTTVDASVRFRQMSEKVDSSISSAVETKSRSCGACIRDFFLGIWNFFRSLLGCGSTPVKTLDKVKFDGMRSIGIDLRGVPHSIVDENKRYVYETLTKGRTPSEIVHFSKKSLSEKELQEVSSSLLCTRSNIKLSCYTQSFPYPESCEEVKYWTANFADSHLFGFCQGPLLAQDELQVLEHPGMYHLKVALENQPEFKTIGPNEAALVENIYRLGELDTQRPLDSGKKLYGNYFASASEQEIASCLTRFDSAVASNIFAMAAPRISASLEGQPYQKAHLEHLFYTAYTAFSAVKERSGDAAAVIHTGNWGAGAFGNDVKTVALIQVAAARLAKVDEMVYHSSPSVFLEASDILNAIASKQDANSFTVDDFLTHLAVNAAKYGLRYGRGNGT